MDVMTIEVIGRSIGTVAAIAGAVFLAYHDRDGWGWLIFVAIMLGCYSIKVC
jgi:hypothetical protein